MPSVNKTNNRIIECHDLAHVVKFSPFELSSDLLAIGTSSQLIVISCQSQEEKASLEDLTFETVADIHHGTRVNDIAWSSQTNIHTVPRLVKLFTAGNDRKVRCLTSDLKGSTTLTILGEHKDYINAIASQPDFGDNVVSVSDDHTCCVWSGDDTANLIVSFPLTSPGMAVCWHPQEPSQIMVAEKNGIIRFYSLVTQQAFMSLDCGQSPLISADWCHDNPLRVAALVGSDWFVFDTSQTSLPLETRMAHSGGGQMIRWCLSHDHLFATTGRPGSMLKVFNMRTNQVILSVEKKILNGLSWHIRQPIVVVGSDNSVHLWIVDV